MIRVEEISDAGQLRSREQLWKSLVARSAHVSIFDTYEWQTSWLEAFWENNAIRFLFFWENDLLVGIAPLLADRCKNRWGSAASVVSTPRDHCSRANVICLEKSTEVLQALITHLGEAGRLLRVVFPSAMANSPVSTVLPGLAAHESLSTAVVPGTLSPILRINGDWEPHLRARSAHLAREVRRKVKRFKSEGRTLIVLVSRPDQCDKALQDVEQIEASSWKKSIDGSLTGNPRLARLYERFALAAAKSRLLRLYLLYLNSKPVAYIYGVVFKNEYYAFKTGYDAAYSRLSPGIVLFDRLFRDAFDQGLAVVDLGPGGRIRWKNDFCNDVRRHIDLCVFSRYSVLCHFCCVYRQQMKPFIKTTIPGLVEFKRKLVTHQ